MKITEARGPKLGWEREFAASGGALVARPGVGRLMLAISSVALLVPGPNSGSLYSEGSVIFNLVMSVEEDSRRRRVVGREKRALRLFVVDPLELVIAADCAGASDSRPGVNRLEEPLQMREGSERIGFALPHA